MRWVLAAFVVGWSVVASAQTMTIPPGFAKTAGGDAYEALAQPGDKIAVQAYRAGEAELVTVAWQWKSESPTRAGLARFERDLVGRSRPDAANEVSNTAMFDRDPMQVEVFDTLAGQRVYHRRLYAVDAKNIVHVWWTVCTAPATAIEPCEQAQRTMKLDLPHALALPALPPPPPPKPSGGAFPVPASYPDADRPGTVDIPAGYHELTIPKLDDALGNIQQLFGRMSDTVGRVFGPPDDSVRLLEITYRLSIDKDAPRELVRQVDAQLPHSVVAPHVLGQNLASEQNDAKLERHVLYGADRDYLYVFSVACIGPVAARAACVRALATMRLAVPDQVPASDPMWELDHHRSALGQLAIVLLVVVAPLAALIWIAKNRQRPRRRVRESPSTAS